MTSYIHDNATLYTEWATWSPTLEAWVTWGPTLEPWVTWGPTLEPSLSASPSSAQCTLFLFVMYVVLGGTMCAFGLLGNVLSLIVFWPDRNKSATIFILVSLAFIDLLVLACWGFISIVPTFVSYTQWMTSFWRFFPYVQAYCYPLATFIHMTTTWLVVIATMQRYIAVCHPHKMKTYVTVRLSQVTVCCMVAVCLLYNIPRFMEYGIEVTERGARRYVTALATSSAYTTIYKVLLYYLIMYCFPLTILVYTSIQLFRSLRKSTIVAVGAQQQQQQQGQPEGQQQQQQQRQTHVTSGELAKRDLTRMLIVLVVVFIICQLTNPVRRIWEEVTSPEQRVCGTAYYYYSPFVALSVMFNSSFNFVIYMTCGMRFRRNFWSRIMACARRQEVHPEESCTELHTASRAGTLTTAANTSQF